MKDTRLHNDCDGGQCCACAWDDEQAKLKAYHRAWFDPSRTGTTDSSRVSQLIIEEAVSDLIAGYSSHAS